MPNQPAPEQLVNVKDPDTGEIGSLPASQAAAAQQQGFAPASDAEVAQHFKEQDYGSVPQQAATLAEGAGDTLSFGLSTGAERALGADPEGIRARREVNPGVHAIGQMAGLGLGMFTGSGEAAALEEGGNALSAVVGLGSENAAATAFKAAKTAALESGAEAEAAEAAGKAARQAALGEYSTLSKIGSTTVKMAAENALFAGGDEVSKMFSGDPNQTVGSALADVGVSGLIGGAFGLGVGAISPLWKSTAGKGIESVLESIRDRAGGIEGSIPDPVVKALNDSGLDMPPHVQATVSEDPAIRNMAKTLEQSDTTASGRGFQQEVESVRKQANEGMLNSLGHTGESAQGLEISKAEAGKSIGHTLADEVAAKIDPLADKFEELKEEFKDVDLHPDTKVEKPAVTGHDGMGMPIDGTTTEVVPGTMSKAADAVAKLAEEQGWKIGDETPSAKVFEYAMKRIGKPGTLSELTSLIKNVGEYAKSLNSMTDMSAGRAGSIISGALKESEADIIASKLGEKGPQLVEEFQNARAGWREVSKLKEALEDRLRVGSSTSGYAKNIREMAKTEGEKLLQRLSTGKDADLLKLLQEQFPQTAEALKRYHIDQVVEHSATKGKAGEISAKALLSKIEGMSPELRKFAIPEEATTRIRAIGAVLEQMEKAPHNFSNTARTVDKLLNYVPASAMGITALLVGHNPLLALGLGGLTKYLSKDAPDAIRLALLKFMGSSREIEGGGFKAAVDMASAAAKGEAAMNKAVKGVLSTGSKAAVPKIGDVSDADTKKLDKRLMALKQDPSPLFGVGNDTAHYLPDHAAVMGQTAARAVNYLNSLRPNDDKRMPFDVATPANPVQKAAFERALRIAEKPLAVMGHVADGTLTPQDVVTLQNVAPGLHERISQKIMDGMVKVSSEEEKIPYHTRMGLAVFLGQPLDSTMTPEGIQSLQAVNQPMGMNPTQQAHPSKAGMQKMKLAQGMADPIQARLMQKHS